MSFLNALLLALGICLAGGVVYRLLYYRQPKPTEDEPTELGDHFK